MNTRWNKTAPRLVLVVFAITAVAFLAYATLNKKVQSQRKAGVQRKMVTEIPPVASKIRSIEIVGTKVINEGTAAVGASVEVRNNSDKAVMAIDLVCGDGAVTKNGLTDEQNPIVVIPPYGTTTIEMTFSEMTADAPLVVSAVTYADGTEEGDEKSLRAMHKVREHDKKMMQEMRAKQKEKP